MKRSNRTTRRLSRKEQATGSTPSTVKPQEQTKSIAVTPETATVRLVIPPALQEQGAADRLSEAISAAAARLTSLPGVEASDVADLAAARALALATPTELLEMARDEVAAASGKLGRSPRPLCSAKTNGAPCRSDATSSGMCLKHQQAHDERMARIMAFLDGAPREGESRGEARRPSQSSPCRPSSCLCELGIRCPCQETKKAGARP